MGNPLSSYLIRKKAESNGLFAELFVFDAKGMNVGQSSVTSDYWQGDEDKYLETFAKGPAAVFVDEIEFNDETRQRRRQVSFTIVDRSEEHTSELQSLMRISYAVFCLKKKKSQYNRYILIQLHY